MESLLTRYENRPEKYRESYYHIKFNADNLFSLNENEDRCLQFIKSHFELGDKHKAFDISFEKDYTDDNVKHEHTVSLYLLGLSLSPFFEEYLKRDLEKRISEVDKWYDFRYSWFLTCLYHDTAGCIEKKYANNANITRGKTLPYFLKLLENNQPIMSPFSYHPTKLGSKLTKFDEKLVKSYFKYRAETAKEIDHGIIGGYLLFDKLQKNFKAKTDGHGNGEPIHLDFEYGNGKRKKLYWRKEQIDHFAYVADAIICHNLWTSSDEKTDAIYQKYGMNQLIIGRGGEGHRLNLADYPLQFMLDLLDTIEPTKRFAQLNAREVLQNVYISFNRENGRRQMFIGWNDLIKQQPEFWNWIQGISSMKNWLDVSVLPCHFLGDICTVEIDF